MEFLEHFVERARAHRRTVVLPEGGDKRVVAAAREIAARGIARVILLDALGQPAGEGVMARDHLNDADRDEFAVQLAGRREEWTVEQAREWLSSPLYFAGMMTLAGQADAMVAGAANETGKVITAGLRTVGLKPGINRLSSFFLMRVADFNRQGPKTFIFADCAVNIAPDASQLADIAVESAASAAKLLDEPAKVAMLSFSTKASAAHASVDTVREATELVRARAPELMIDGELQVDAALSPDVATRKVSGDAGVAGQANVLIFPNLDAGNIGYKLVRYMAGADAIGPFFQGFAQPVCDLSRGCSVNDIIAAVTIMLAMADHADSAII